MISAPVHTTHQTGRLRHCVIRDFSPGRITRLQLHANSEARCESRLLGFLSHKETGFTLMMWREALPDRTTVGISVGGIKRHKRQHASGGGKLFLPSSSAQLGMRSKDWPCQTGVNATWQLRITPREQRPVWACFAESFLVSKVWRHVHAFPAHLIFTAFATLVQCVFFLFFFTGTIVFADISSNTVCECMVSQ